MAPTSGGGPVYIPTNAHSAEKRGQNWRACVARSSWWKSGRVVVRSGGGMRTGGCTLVGLDVGGRYRVETSLLHD